MKEYKERNCDDISGADDFTESRMKIGDQIIEVLLKHQNIQKKEARKSVEMFELVGIPSPEKKDERLSSSV